MIINESEKNSPAFVHGKLVGKNGRKKKPFEFAEPSKCSSLGLAGKHNLLPLFCSLFFFAANATGGRIYITNS